MSFSPDPAQQLLSAGALERAAGLRRMKAVALGLLILLAVVFVVAFPLQDTHPVWGYVRAAADAHFDVVRREVEASPEDWGGWYRLGLAYSASGDSRRARGAMRTAIALHRGADPETALARSGR